MALPDRIFAHASPRSVGGRSLFDPKKGPVRLRAARAFASPPGLIAIAAARLRAAGFDILQMTPYTINIAASPDVYRAVFGRNLVEKEVPLPNGGTSTHIECQGCPSPRLIPVEGTEFADILEGVALEVPRSLVQVSTLAPNASYWHLRTPGDLALGLNALPLHRHGIDGRGVRVAMVDTGWFRHPYFDAYGYDIAPVVLGPGATLPEVDDSGHGTGESANVLALAPGCQLIPVKHDRTNMGAAFNQAVSLRPDIITCSWTGHRPFELDPVDMALEASVAEAVASGITVIFSAGNGHAGFPGQHPDVISAGGVFMHQDGTLEAATYASGFQSQIYPNRRVPDVCGLVGHSPDQYVMLPVPPGCEIDLGQATAVPSDETAVDDGWAAFSGTSAAAPQLAGIAALIKQVVRKIAPAAMKSAMMQSARDVTFGFCSPVGGLHGGLPSHQGPDDATGTGLVDALGAVQWAYLYGGAARA
jgi:Subtilase family